MIGNPKTQSRTASVGEAIAHAVARRAGREAQLTLVELADLGCDLFGSGNSTVAEAKGTVLSSELLVVATPVYKASYTGLLKAFLDQFARDELAAMPTVPTMVGAAELHGLAVETQLRPVLVEIGASMPTRGLFVTEAGLDTLESQLADFLDLWGGVLLGAIAGRPAPTTRDR